MGNKWSVKKIPADHPRYAGQWGVYDGRTRYEWMDGPVLHDVLDSLPAAHTYATQLAVADELFEPGGLTWLSAMKCRASIGETILRPLDPPVVW